MPIIRPSAIVCRFMACHLLQPYDTPVWSRCHRMAEGTGIPQKNYLRAVLLSAGRSSAPTNVVVVDTRQLAEDRADNDRQG
jgi:hypothetical protein